MTGTPAEDGQVVGFQVGLLEPFLEAPAGGAAPVQGKGLASPGSRMPWATSSPSLILQQHSFYDLCSLKVSAEKYHCFTFPEVKEFILGNKCCLP